MDELNAGLTIKLVAERTGVSEYTLRAWERRYGVPRPKRVPGNRYRVYAEQDIADVLWMKQQIEAGVAPAQASVLFRQQAAVHSLSLTKTQPVAAARSSLLDTLLQPNEFDAKRALDQVFALFPLQQVMMEIIQPVMREVGEAWLRNEISVWQEHFASNLIRQKLFAVLQAQSSAPLNSPRLVAACAPGEEHELGLLALVLMAQQRGWWVTYLGRQTPLADLTDIVEKANPRVVLISLTTVVGLASLMPWLNSTVRPNVALCFGGSLVDQVPGLRGHLPGVYVGADLFTAVQGLDAVKLQTGCWKPSKRSWQAAQALFALRLTIAGEVATRFVADLPPNLTRSSTWHAPEIGYATLYLIDAMVSALAFGAPELMLMQKTWMQGALPARNVPVLLIAEHLKLVARVMDESLTREVAELFKPLLDQLADHTDSQVR